MKLVMVVLLSVFDFSHVELTYSADLVVFMHNSWRLALCLRQDYVDEVLKFKSNMAKC